MRKSVVLPAPFAPMTPTMPPGGSRERQILNEQSIVESLRDTGPRSRRRSPKRGPGGDGDLEAIGATLARHGLRDELVECTEASFAFALTGPRRHADPLQLTFECRLADLVRLLFSGESGLLLLEPRRSSCPPQGIP